MIRHLVPFLIASTMLASCASREPPRSNSEGARRLANTTTAAAIPVSGLPAQKLEKGECGVFLWGLTTPRRLVFFTETTSSEALVLVGDAARSLQLTAARGDVIGSYLTESDFREKDGQITASLVIVPGETIEDGQRIGSGRLVIRDTNGWETVLPVAGLYACIPG